jgi:hypothetical protein
LCSIKHHGGVSIAIDAFADIYHLPDSDDMVAHPALLVPHNIPVDEDAILPYFPNLVEALPGEFNATPFFVAHNIPFHKSKLVLHCIFGHTLSSPDQSDPYDIPDDIFCNSQILSHNCPSEPSSEEDKASLLAMESHLFGHLQDSTKLQTRSIY